MNNENENNRNEEGPKKHYNGKVEFFHPKRTANGSAARFELRLNRAGEEGYNCFFLEMANQKTARTRESNATFNWEQKITVKLGFFDVCHFLTVLEGKCVSVGGKKEALYHQNGGTSTLIGFKVRPNNEGYFLGLSKKNGSAQARKVSMALSEVEATGLRHVFQAALFYMSFAGSLLASQGRVTDGF